MTMEQHQRLGRMEILTTGQGAVAGLAGSLALAAVAMLGSRAAGDGLWTPINAAGAFFTGADSVPPDPAGLQTLVGVLTVLGVGLLLGVLYATAQEPVDTPSLLIIAVYYGFLIWFIATFAVLSWLNPLVHDVWRSWYVLAGSLAYGAVLGLAAALRNPQGRER